MVKHSRSDETFGGENYLATMYSPVNKPESGYPGMLADYLATAYLSQCQKGIDLGCGRGDMLRAFGQKGFDVCGIDLSATSRTSCDPYPVEIVDMETAGLPYEDSSFDFTFSKSVIEHLSNPLNLMMEARRILRAGGMSIFLTPSWRHTAWGPFYLDHTHVTPFTKPSLENALRMAGYDEIKVFEFYQLPRIWKHKWLIYMAKLIAFLPIPYRPMFDAPWNDAVNKTIRFSNEVMLLAVCRG